MHVVSRCAAWLWRLAAAGLWICVCCLPSGAARGSDHADPIMLREVEAGLTGLFVFPRDDRLVIVLCTRRALTSGPPLQLEPYRYTVHIDTHSEVSFANQDARARYGGEVVDPAGIRPDVSIEMRLNEDASLREHQITGLRDPSRVRIWAGLRDDPFIFYRFSRTNVIGMVIEIPFDEFRESQVDWLVWGTSSRHGRQIDHVGRSLRTMLPRFDFLNTLPPGEHVAAIRRRHTDPGVLQDILAANLSPLFAIRHYDFAPDVIIFSKRFPTRFPNGRLLTDDVAKLCCEQGDCLLYEISLSEAHADHQPRPVANNKPFLEEFPYLAEPNENPVALPSTGLKMRTKLILGAIGLGLLLLVLWPWVLWWRCRVRLRRLQAAG